MVSPRSAGPPLGADGRPRFGLGEDGPTAQDVADYYRPLNIACVIFAVDAERMTGVAPVANEEVAEIAAANPDVLIPFASVDPHRGAGGVRRVRQLVEQHGVRGFKFHPSLQEFAPDDRSVYPYYEAIEELGVPALFHTGQTFPTAGRALRLRYSNPMLLDDVAVDFPQLRIVLAHPSVPWQDEAISIALTKPNVYIDLSGWSPKYFPAQLVHHANTLLKDKVLFGTDFPIITPERWLADFDALGCKPEVVPLILKRNALTLLGETAPTGQI